MIHLIEKMAQRIIALNNLKFICWKVFDTYQNNVPDDAVELRILIPTTLFPVQKHLQHLSQNCN